MRDRGREGGREGRGREGDTRRSARHGYAYKNASGCLTLHWHVGGRV